MNEIENYHILKVGDLVRMVGANIGIVTKVLEYGQIQVFWPMSKKFSEHGKKWAELHLEIVEHV